ncbi:MAG: hypothetical protein P1R58_11635, partial [bacterium]|nr:hypothetical protein [bacterium]
QLHDLRFKVGYSDALADWQYKFGVAYRLSKKHRLSVGGSVEEQIAHRSSTTTSTRYNPTALALAYQIDPFDYLYQRGFDLAVSIKPLKKTTLWLILESYKQRSVDLQTDYSLFSRDSSRVRSNPAIDEGDKRSLLGAISFDTRQLFRNKGREGMFGATQYLKVTVVGEYSSPDFLNSDFDYSKFYIRVERHQRTLGMGVSQLTLFAGLSNRSLPFQEQFVIDHGTGGLFFRNSSNTLREEKFSGDRAASIYLNHNFDQLLFKKSELPLVSKLPFTLSLHGGLFWTEFKNTKPLSTADGQFLTTSKPYSEIGFGLGNLTPFITPLNLAIWMTWQLSDYDTESFRLQLGLKL